MISTKIGFGISLLLSVLIFTPKAKTSSYTKISETIVSDTILSGKELARIYCAMCHTFPEPLLLDKKTWTSSVLPNMALRLGIKNTGASPFEGLLKDEIEIIKSLGVYPETQAISTENWNKIVAYYNEEAPLNPIPQGKRENPINHIGFFKPRKIFLGDKPLPKTSMLKFDKRSSRLYVGDAQNILYVLNSEMELERTRKVQSAPVDIDFPSNDAPRILYIGEFNPSDKKSGRLASLYRYPGENNKPTNINALPRPVQFAVADLNMDNKEDVIICGFGNHSGNMSWYDNFQPTEKHVLSELPGARKVEILDMNKDGLPDIVSLRAQAYEQMSIYYNKGNGTFDEEIVLEFSPVHGVSYFELVDFNKDGFQDILLTNGDNWDLSAIDKNYHGVRIFMNDSANNFSESYFYPIYGASKALARDFDNDGDLDIAAISFYSNLENPGHGFIYLSNEGGMSFNSYYTPLASEGKWLTMEAADFDNDGDIDIAIGSYFHKIAELTKLIFKGVLSFPQLLVFTNELENDSKE
jgi:hypothetical protein